MGKLEEKFKETTGKLEEKFREATGKFEEKYNVVEKMIQCLEKHNYFEWKISGFSKASKIAKTGDKNYIYSESFCRYGYKCRLRCDPNGFGSGKNTHLSIFFQIMKGENDNILPWPFHKKVTVILIDQQEDATDRENIFSYFIADPENPNTKTQFAKPVTDKNPLWGFFEFASHSKLRERRYIADDNIIIHVRVSPPQ